MTRVLRTALLASGMVLSSPGLGHAQSGYYSGAYAFGDSLTDNGRIPRETGYSPSGTFDARFGTKLYEGGRLSNAPGYFEQIPARIGAPYVPGNDYAIGGSQAVHLEPNAQFSPLFPWGVPDQIDQFAARTGRFGSRDLVTLWIGYNDITAIPAVTAAARAAGVTTILNNNVANLDRLVGLGARELLVFSQQTFRAANADLARSFNAQLPGYLQAYSDRGINVHYFDADGLLNRLRADPTAYGFIPQAATGSCAFNPACAVIGYTNPAVENQYISVDGIHLTARANGYLAAFVANQLNAPLTIGPQGELGQAAGLAFSSTLIDFLGAERRRNMALSVPAAFAADLPGRRPAPGLIPVQPGSPVSVFALGTYAGLDRTAQNRAGAGSLGNTYDANFGGVTAGLLYQATPNLVLGAAFNYLNARVDLRGASNGRIDLDSVQGAVFASYATPEVFADVAVTYGGNGFALDRPGVLNDRLAAAPGGDTVTVAARTGYLFDFETFRAGPIGEVTYARAGVSAYRETGDPLLTIGVRRQDLDGLTVGGGLQIRTVAPLLGGIVSPFLNLTAQHDVLDGVRTVTSFQTYAPSLLIRTETGRRGDDVYGRIAGGLDLDFGNGLSGVVTGSTSVARAGGDDYTGSVGLRYRF